MILILFVDALGHLNGIYKPMSNKNNYLLRKSSFSTRKQAFSDISKVQLHCDGIYYQCIDYRLYSQCIFLAAGGIGVTPTHCLLKQLLSIKRNFNIDLGCKPINIVFIWYYQDTQIFKICQETINWIETMIDSSVIVETQCTTDKVHPNFDYYSQNMWQH